MARGLLGFFSSLFSGRPVVVPDASKLLEGEARMVDLSDPLAGGRQVLLMRVDGAVYAFDAVCPHAEGGRFVKGPLEEGRYAKCPLHNYRFDPKTGEAVGVACRSARRYRVRERNGSIELFA